MIRNTIPFLLLLLLSAPLSGQKPHYQVFQNIALSTEASSISYFLQDGQGMMWIGSDKGLFSYDGYTPRAHFANGERNNTRIYCGITLEDRLYLGADNGLLIYNVKTDRYEEPEIQFPTDIRAMVLRENTLWIGTLNGLFTYNFSTQELQRFNREREKGLPHETIYSILHTADDILYIGTYNGLCRYLPAGKRFEEIPLPTNIKKSNLFVNSLLEDSTRRCIWIGTEGNLFNYSLRTKKVEPIETFHDNSVKTLALDYEGNLLAGTDNGLYIYHEAEPLRHILHDSRNTLSLSNNIIWSIFTDDERNIWLGTDYGISLSRFNNNIQYIPISQITATGDGNIFYSLFRDSQGVYWFGGTNGLIRFTDISGNNKDAVWYRMGDNRHPLPHNRIRHIYEDRDKELWIATDGSINRYNRQTGQFTNYSITDSTGTYNANWAYNLYEDDSGKLWIASCLGGLFVVDKEKLMQAPAGRSYKAEFLLSTANGLSGMFINQIVPDRKGNIWALLYNASSINIIDTKTQKVERLAVEEMSGINSFSFMICDEEGAIWLGYRGGVMRFGEERNKPDIIRLGEFAESDILSMLEVEENIWISTTDGIWMLNKQTKDTRRLKMMNRTFFSQYYDRKENKIYLGSADGFAVSSPELSGVGATDRPILATALYVNNQLIAHDGQIGKQSIRHAQSITLNHTQNHLSIEVSDLPYSLDDKNKFVYKMDGLDNEWSLLKQNSNRITYSNLDDGKYRLIVSKLDANGKPSGKQYTLDIQINPPWYYTVWAKCLYGVISVSLIIWMINFFRVKRRLKLERLEKKKLIEQSQEKIDFYTKLSEDLQSSLDHANASSLVRRKLEEEIQARNRLEQMTNPKQIEIISQDEKLLANITRIIEEHIADPDLNVNALCEASGISNKQLYRKIKQLTGVTPVEYIKTIRMKRAAMLLSQKKLSVSEVMYRVGYSNHSYFSKCFQGEFGKTPKQFTTESH